MTDLLTQTRWRLLPPAEAVDAARADQDARWRAGSPLLVEQYLEALPAVAADAELALVLVYGEVLSRTACGETPDVAEYRTRFPQWADRIDLQFAVHAALHPSPDPVPRTVSMTGPLTHSGPPAHPSAPMPERVGPYRILGELGRGGMGVVFAAFDPALDREVAVKTLAAGRPHDTAAARFRQEARIAARVQHPSVPPVYAVGELPDGIPYLAMKRVRGRTLADLLRDRSTPSADLSRLVGVFEQVCHAVGYAHAQGVIHRDLKPSNVMVGEFGEVQVMDWGLARVLAGRECERSEEPITPADLAPGSPSSALTRTGTVLGTPAYMAPEQARGEPADQRADVFALGGLLCVLLTGQPPFVAADPYATWKLARDGQTTDALGRLAGCQADPELVGIAVACLAAVAADRPTDGRAVAELVAGYRAGVAERLRRSETEQAAAAARAEEGRRKRRWQWTAAGVLAVLVTAGGLFAWWQDVQVRERRAELDRVERAKRANDDALAGRNAEALEGLLGEAHQALADGDAARAAGPIEQAEKRTNDVGGAEFADRVARCRRDLDMLRDVDAVDALYYQNAEVIVGDGGDKMAPLLKAVQVFRQYGLEFGVTRPSDAARIIHGSLIRETLECALARGFAIVLTMEQGTNPTAWWLLKQSLKVSLGRQVEFSAAGFAEYLNALDADPYRTRVRAALVRAAADKNPAPVLDLLDRPEAVNQEPHFVHMIAAAGSVPYQRRVAALRQSFTRWPKDFRLHFGMGYYTYDTDEAAGWMRSAAAIRPSSALAWAALADELRLWSGREAKREQTLQSQAERQQDPVRRADSTIQAKAAAAHRRELLVEAEAAIRQSVTLEPASSFFRFRHGVLLTEVGRCEEAFDAYLWAAALDPAAALPRAHVGWAFDALRTQQTGISVLAGGPAVRSPLTPAEVQFRLGVRIRQVGVVGWAEREQRAALAADPNHPGAKKELELIAGLRMLGVK